MNLLKLTIKPVLYIGLGVFIFGSMLHQHSLTQKGHLIAESYVARNQTLLDEAESFDPFMTSWVTPRSMPP